MSDSHKEALAEGRVQGRVVRAYLEALEEHRPRPGRKRTEESVRRRLEAVERELADASAYERLSLLQERIDLQRELETMATGTGLAALEDEFVAVAKSYSERKGITYSVWIEVGVPAAVLKRAGIARRS